MGTNDPLPSAAVRERLGSTTEQQRVVGPTVQFLLSKGWSIDQMIFGKAEWRIPKSPSQATKRERSQSFEGFPVDIAVFDTIEHVGDPSHLAFVVECKLPDDSTGLSQLESYFVGEPHAKLGVLVNSTKPSAQATFLYRNEERLQPRRQPISQLPCADEPIVPNVVRTCFDDLIEPDDQVLKRCMSDLLDKVVVSDAIVTGREDQLDQLCNLLLLKLESDKQAKADPNTPVFFRQGPSAHKTAAAIRNRYRDFIEIYPEVFTTEKDRILRLSDDTIEHAVGELAGLRLSGLSVSTVSVAFQVLRSNALKQTDGQYFTPPAVIEAGVRLMNIEFQDRIIDPACGTGGFLVETMLDMARRNPGMVGAELSKWAQTHIFGIDKDAVGVKLTKAIMQIADDGSANIARGDSVRTNRWAKDFDHLLGGKFRDGRFTKVLTNPPFGTKLKVSAEDARLAGLTLASETGRAGYRDLEIGILFLQRAHQLLAIGGKLGIVLPETYFFSNNYQFIFDWLKPRMRPLVVANIPMEAFQGFCRAKTNFYVFEKIA